MKYHEANGEIMYESESYRREIMVSMAAIMYHGVMAAKASENGNGGINMAKASSLMKAK
jgi:hypothetical protein